VGPCRAIGIGAGLAARPLPHHRAYGSVHGGSDRLPDRANRWKSKRSEVTIRQRYAQRRATTQAPCTVRRTHGLGGKVSGHSPRDQFPESGPALFPLLPEETAKTPTNPFIQLPKHAGRFAETEVATPSAQISIQRPDQLVDADPARALSQLPDSILEASQRLGRNAPFDLYSSREGESSPEESHPQALVERCVSLSTHTAPIRQTYRPYRVASARRGPDAYQQAAEETGSPGSCEP
jgi:hypothetical protein